VVGHRDRYRAKLEQLKFANAHSRKQLDQIEQEVIKFTNRVITSTIARGKIEFTEEGESKPAGRSHRPHSILARRVFGNSDTLLGIAPND
jgi:hypothetical protein